MVKRKTRRFAKHVAVVVISDARHLEVQATVVEDENGVTVGIVPEGGLQVLHQ